MLPSASLFKTVPEWLLRLFTLETFVSESCSSSSNGNGSAYSMGSPLSINCLPSSWHLLPDVKWHSQSATSMSLVALSFSMRGTMICSNPSISILSTTKSSSRKDFNIHPTKSTCRTLCISTFCCSFFEVMCFRHLGCSPPRIICSAPPNIEIEPGQVNDPGSASHAPAAPGIRMYCEVLGHVRACSSRHSIPVTFELSDASGLRS
mmetsp:Transcript_11214/g.27748  ORF Transcript_11214/g.27748 Transcript_11214/m.27748 type:complete len:206 (+) Transcript_11214:185-802(+)